MYTSQRYARYALIVIFFANFFSYCDRTIISALEKELRHAFNMSEEAFGGLWTAFTVGYMVFAPIVGYLADRATRTKVFSVCIFVWSIATIASGCADSEAHLYVARVFIGLGEAGCLVIGPALITDLFSKEQRGRMLSVFFLALPLGGTAGYLLAACLVGLPAHSPAKKPAAKATAKSSAREVKPPEREEPARPESASSASGRPPASVRQPRTYFGIEDWRFAFAIAGFPGLILAFLVWSMIDPPRGGDYAHLHAHIQGVKPYLELLRNRTLLLVILAQAFAVIFLVPLLHFGVGYFESRLKVSKREATLSLGLIILAAGTLGSVLSGFLGDKLAKRSRGAYSRMSAIAFFLGWPFLLLGFQSHDQFIVFPALGVGAFFYFLCMPAINTQIANAVPAKERGMAWALAVFVLHLLGDTSAPLIFGEASQRWGRPRAFSVFSLSMVAASVCCWIASRTAARDELKAQAEDEAD